ncbi:hypothetical protein [Chryseobacterium sp. MA9]|uniref:hypothetical protein n=1 Tax=Chryseobacterium sp. MA9 TaxID=2966625 RepID=UPI0021054AED|nr:hypothetical protein [Chryseobacterium sp. MA9]UTX50779.1 hypothetical protein KIK00_11135 [Chryseobacterium sp. MA9]
MKKITFIILFFFFANSTFAQIGINTPNPQTMFHVDGQKDNPTTGVPNTAQQLNDFAVTSNGDVGVGTTNPTSKLELNSGTNNVSGLKFTNLTSASPVSNGAILGVDASGNVIKTQFTPLTGESVLNGNYDLIPTGPLPFQENFNILNITLPAAGTYEIKYQLYAQINLTASTVSSTASVVAWLTTAPSPGNLVVNSAVFVCGYQVPPTINSTTAISGGNMGTMTVTVTGPTTYYLGARFTYGTTGGTGGTARLHSSDSLGRTKMSYIQLAP